MPKKIIKKTWDDRVVDSVSYLIAGLLAVVCVLPFIYVIVYSIIPFEDYMKNPLSPIPRNITLSAYYSILKFKYIRIGYSNTIFISVVGTVISMLLLIVTAYPLTKKNLKGRNFILTLWIITMFFNGGLIPNYYLIKSLKLYNTLWALILPGLAGAFNIVLMKNFMNEIPTSLEESAMIDGASEIRILFTIVTPLCVPALVTLGLFHIVNSWNSYFSAIIYITKRTLWPLQLVLRELIVESNVAEVHQDLQAGQDASTPFTIKMAAIIVTTLPIMCVYPFLQKYFMKGLLLGGVKE
jgi:putative aldouronate transport system permease protein